MKICWFGIYRADYSRNKVYISGLKQLGVEIIECQDARRGFAKYVGLFRKYIKIRNSYDFLVVGYPGHSVVWFAKLLSRKPVIFDALCTMEEGVLVSRGQYGFLGLKALYIKFIDWLAVKCADFVLVETEAQRRFFESKFGKSDKYKVIYTGVDEEFFFKKAVEKNSEFTVVFRGKFLPEAGVKHIVDAAKLLKNESINFIIIGNGFLEREIALQIEEYQLPRLTLISRFLSPDELREAMLTSHVSLGQFEDHERLKRTIPHKCFESLAIGLPYITARTEPVSEILQDGESVVFVSSADPEDLAQKILMLKNDPGLAQKIGENGHKIFLQELTPEALALQILNLLR
jgi:glycosyltransferase involved in cell wall biosynthesis